MGGDSLLTQQIWSWFTTTNSLSLHCPPNALGGFFILPSTVRQRSPECFSQIIMQEIHSLPGILWTWSSPLFTQLRANPSSPCLYPAVHLVFLWRRDLNLGILFIQHVLLPAEPSRPHHFLFWVLGRSNLGLKCSILLPHSPQCWDYTGM